MTKSGATKNSKEAEGLKQTWAAKIIFGEPKDKDELDGKGHYRSARALADAIRQLAERLPDSEVGLERKRLGGAIGLEGAWGSGKSSVIEIAANPENNLLDESYHVFTFDLWRHQTDDFRRALLEELLRFVRSNFNPKDADEKRPNQPDIDLNISDIEDEVRSRKTVTTTTSVRRLNGVAVCLLAGLPLLPIIYAWLHPSVLQGLNFPTVGLVSGAWHWSIAGAVAYIAVFIAICLRAFDSQSYPFKESDFTGVTRKLRGGASHLFNLSQRDRNNKVTQAIRDENPTTVEFRTVFEKILKPVQDTGAKVVFVLDNIDRLPVDQVAKTWSEMRSLVSANGVEPSTAVIAVIPFDRAHISQAFPPIKIPKMVSSRPAKVPAIQDKAEGEATSDKEKLTRSPEPEVQHLVFESDVFEKTFDRIVKVAAPVGSDWKTYLDNCLQKAFLEEDYTACSGQLYRLLRYQLELEGVHPTPRRIISYVNEIGGLWAEWRGEGIPMQTVALYVLHRNRIDRDPSVLSAAEIVDKRFERIVDDQEYQKHLAALAFNVSPERANQVRLGIAIRHALTSNDGAEQLRKMMDQHGFFEFFEKELEEILAEWSVDAQEKVAQAAYIVSQIELPQTIHGDVWSVFASIVGHLPSMRLKQMDDLDGLYHVVGQQDSSRSGDVAQSILMQVEQSFSPEKADNDETKNLNFIAGRQWMRVIFGLCKAIEKAAGEEASIRFFSRTMPYAVTSFTLGAAVEWRALQLHDFNMMNPQSSEQSESKLLLSWAESTPAAYDTASFLFRGRLNKFCEDHALKIGELLGNVIEPSTHRHLASAAVTLLSSMEFKTFSTGLSQSATDGSLAEIAHAMLNSGKAEERWQGRQALVLTALLMPGEPFTIPRTGASNSDAMEWYNSLLDGSEPLQPDDLRACASIVAYANQITKWILCAVDDEHPNGFLRALLPYLAEEALPLIGLLSLLKAFDKIEAASDRELAKELLRKVEGSEKEFDSELYGGTVLEIPPSAITAICELEDDAQIKHVLALIETYLASMNEQEWFTAFSTKKDAARGQMIALLKNKRRVSVGDAYQAALKKVARQILDSFDPIAISKEWPVLLSALTDVSDEELRHDLASIVLKEDMTPEKAVRFVSAFRLIANRFEFSGTKEKAKDALLGFFSKLKRANDDTAQDYLATMEPEIERCRKKVGVKSSVVKEFDAIGSEGDDVEEES